MKKNNINNKTIRTALKFSVSNWHDKVQTHTDDGNANGE